MIANKPLRTLLLAALATPLLALCVELPQDPEPEDWARHVNKACTSRRYGIRLAAARNNISALAELNRLVAQAVDEENKAADREPEPAPIDREAFEALLAGLTDESDEDDY